MKRKKSNKKINVFQFLSVIFDIFIYFPVICFSSFFIYYRLIKTKIKILCIIEILFAFNRFVVLYNLIDNFSFYITIYIIKDLLLKF